nr:IS30-like element ISAba125 family transposase [Klebsiella pneumoniae]
MSYHHLNFEDRTALMLESRKEGFSARKFAELIKRHPSTIYRELKRNSINDVYQARYASDNTFAREGANKRGNSSRLTQSFHFFMFEPIFSPVNALNQPI